MAPLMLSTRPLLDIDDIVGKSREVFRDTSLESPVNEPLMSGVVIPENRSYRLVLVTRNLLSLKGVP